MSRLTAGSVWSAADVCNGQQQAASVLLVLVGRTVSISVPLILQVVAHTDKVGAERGCGCSITHRRGKVG